MAMQIIIDMKLLTTLSNMFNVIN